MHTHTHIFGEFLSKKGTCPNGQVIGDQLENILAPGIWANDFSGLVLTLKLLSNIMLAKLMMST